MAQSVWTGGSHHTGLAALPHENIHEIDYMEDTLADLAGKPTSKDNIFKKVESALSRFLRQKDANGNQYYYESIHVQSARDYENYLKNLLQK